MQLNLTTLLFLLILTDLMELYDTVVDIGMFTTKPHLCFTIYNMFLIIIKPICFMTFIAMNNID